ncbi:Uncharacterised protein [Mycobacteroides abscessus subsp. abscessus]|nr:Uncharacterised protein [Mycobacteroides abscessus subsp. abscessus]
MSEWYSTGYTARRGTRERLVRAWEPGDGIACTNSRNRSRVACGEPVAVVKDVETKEAGFHTPQVINRVFCLRHLANNFGENVGVGAENDIERKALEQVAKQHWDEYQTVVERMRSELLEARFAALPKDLRDKVIKIVQEESGDSE